jgi:hypothetical protein
MSSPSFASRVVFSHCERARREFAPAGDSLSLLVQRKEAKKAPQIPSGCLQWPSAACSAAVLTQQLASRLKQCDLSLQPHTSADRGVLHRSACEGYRPATTRRVSLKTRPSPRPSPADAGEGAHRGRPPLPHQRERVGVKVQSSSQPRWPVQGPPARASGAVKYASVQGGLRPQAKVALFEPRGELLRKQCRGAGSRHALVTPRWVLRCFLCFLSLHQQRKWVAGRGEFPAGSHAVRNSSHADSGTKNPG